MKKKPLGKGAKILLVLAVVVAIITGYGVYQFLDQQNTTIYVYNAAYESGTPITGDMFSKSSYPVSLYNLALSTGVGYATADQISAHISSGDCLLVDVAQYSPCMSNQFVASGGTSLENRLDENMVSVELSVEDILGLGGQLRIGSRINLISGYSVDTTKCTELIFQNLLIVDIKKDQSGVVQSVFVEVSPEESLQLIHAMQFESLTATVLKPNFYEGVSEKDALYERSYVTEGQGSGYYPNIGQ